MPKLITREAVEKVYASRKKAEIRETKEILERTLTRISTTLAKGKLYIPNIGSNPEVQKAIAKALAKEDINIEFIPTEFKGKRGKSLRDCKITNARISLKDEQ